MHSLAISCLVAVGLYVPFLPIGIWFFITYIEEPKDD